MASIQQKHRKLSVAKAQQITSIFDQQLKSQNFKRKRPANEIATGFPDGRNAESLNFDHRSKYDSTPKYKKFPRGKRSTLDHQSVSAKQPKTKIQQSNTVSKKANFLNSRKQLVSQEHTSYPNFLEHPEEPSMRSTSALGTKHHPRYKAINMVNRPKTAFEMHNNRTNETTNEAIDSVQQYAGQSIHSPTNYSQSQTTKAPNLSKRTAAFNENQRQLPNKQYNCYINGGQAPKPRGQKPKMMSPLGLQKQNRAVKTAKMIQVYDSYLAGDNSSYEQRLYDLPYGQHFSVNDLRYQEQNLQQMDFDEKGDPANGMEAGIPAKEIAFLKKSRSMSQNISAAGIKATGISDAQTDQYDQIQSQSKMAQLFYTPSIKIIDDVEHDSEYNRHPAAQKQPQLVAPPQSLSQNYNMIQSVCNQLIQDDLPSNSINKSYEEKPINTIKYGNQITSIEEIDVMKVTLNQIPIKKARRRPSTQLNGRLQSNKGKLRVAKKQQSIETRSKQCKQRYEREWESNLTTEPMLTHVFNQSANSNYLPIKAKRGSMRSATGLCRSTTQPSAPTANTVGHWSGENTGRVDKFAIRAQEMMTHDSYELPQQIFIQNSKISIEDQSQETKPKLSLNPQSQDKPAFKLKQHETAPLTTKPQDLKSRQTYKEQTLKADKMLLNMNKNVQQMAELRQDKQTQRERLLNQEQIEQNMKNIKDRKDQRAKHSALRRKQERDEENRLSIQLKEHYQQEIERRKELVQDNNSKEKTKKRLQDQLNVNLNLSEQQDYGEDDEDDNQFSEQFQAKDKKPAEPLRAAKKEAKFTMMTMAVNPKNCQRCTEPTPDGQDFEHKQRVVDGHKALQLVRDKIKNPCFKTSQAYVKLNKIYSLAMDNMELNMVPLKPDSPSNCNLSYYKTQSSKLNTTDDLQPYIGGTKSSIGLSKKILNTKLIKEAQLDSKAIHDCDICETIEQADYKKVSEVYLHDVETMKIVEEEDLIRKRDNLFDFAKQLYLQNIQNRLTVTTQAFHPLNSNQANMFCQNIIQQNHNRHNALSLSSVCFKLDNPQIINMISMYFNSSVLSELNLSKNSLSASAILILCNEVLQRTNSIISLNLSQTTLDPPCVQLLCDTLINRNQSVISLDLSNGAPAKTRKQPQGSQVSQGQGHLDNRIGPMGAQQLAQLLMESPFIQYLNVQNVYATGQGFRDMMQAILFNRVLMAPDLNDFKSMNLGGNGVGVADIHNMIRLMESDLKEKRAFREATLQIGADMDWKHAKYNRSKPGSKLTTPSQNTKVTTPNVKDGRKIINSVADLCEQQDFNLLDELNISSNPKISGCNISRFIDSLCRHAFVSRINLSNCNLFNLEGPQLLSKLLTIKKSVKLQELKVLEFTQKECAELVASPVCDQHKFFMDMSVNNKITSLNLSKNKFLTDNETVNATFGYKWDYVLKAINTFTQYNKAIVNLNLAHCLLSDEGASALFEGLNFNPKSQIKHLNLKGNFIKDNACLDQLLPLLAKGKMKIEKPQTKLGQREKFHDCHKADFSCKHICRIEHLDLSSNQISDFTGEKLAMILKRNNILKHLNLADNLLKDACGEKFEHTLDINKSLVYLNLELNSIKHKYIEKISSKVKSNKSNNREKGIGLDKIQIQKLEGDLEKRQEKQTIQEYLKKIRAEMQHCKQIKEEEAEALKEQIELDKIEKNKMAAITKEHFDNCVVKMKNNIAKRMIFNLKACREANLAEGFQNRLKDQQAETKNLASDQATTKLSIQKYKSELKIIKQKNQTEKKRIMFDVNKENATQEMAYRKYYDALNELKSEYASRSDHVKVRELEKKLRAAKELWNMPDHGLKRSKSRS